MFHLSNRGIFRRGLLTFVFAVFGCGPSATSTSLSKINPDGAAIIFSTTPIEASTATIETAGSGGSNGGASSGNQVQTGFVGYSNGLYWGYASGMDYYALDGKLLPGFSFFVGADGKENKQIIVADGVDANTAQKQVAAMGGAAALTTIVFAKVLEDAGCNDDKFENLLKCLPQYSLSVGPEHSCALAQGNVYCWGSNQFGQLGASVSVVYSDSSWVLAPKAVYLSAEPIKVPFPKDTSGKIPPIRMLVSGARHNCALTQEGKVFCWGYNQNGELGLPANLMITKVVAQMEPNGTTVHSFDPNVSYSAIPKQPKGMIEQKKILFIAARGSATCALDSEGGLHCWGALPSHSFQAPSGQNGSVSISPSFKLKRIAVSEGGSKFAPTICGISNSTGKVYCLKNGKWTWADVGKDAADKTLVATDLVSGAEHICAILTLSNTMKCWGVGALGKLGNGSMNDAFPYAGLWFLPLKYVQKSSSDGKTAALTGVASGSSGDVHSCAITTAGKIYCWGHNHYNVFGTTKAGDTCYPDAKPFNIDPNTDKQIPNPNFGIKNCSKIAILSDFLNDVNKKSMKAVAIGAGQRHTCALFEDKTVSCWGENDWNQLGTSIPDKYHGVFVLNK